MQLKTTKRKHPSIKLQLKLDQIHFELKGKLNKYINAYQYIDTNIIITDGESEKKIKNYS